MSQLVYIKTETVPEDQQKSFGSKLVTDDAKDIVTINNTFGGSIKVFTIRRVVVGPKWSLGNNMFLSESLCHDTSVEHSVIENFLKLLYGFNVGVSLNELYNIWRYSDDTGYHNKRELLTTLEANISSLESRKQFEILMLSQNKSAIVSKLTLNQLKQLVVEYSETLPREVLVAFFISAVDRYKADTTAQRTEIKKINGDLMTKSKELTTKTNELEQLKKLKSSTGNPYLDALGSLGRNYDINRQDNLFK